MGKKPEPVTIKKFVLTYNRGQSTGRYSSEVTATSFVEASYLLRLAMPEVNNVDLKNCVAVTSLPRSVNGMRCFTNLFLEGSSVDISHRTKVKPKQVSFKLF